jgi:hypothetical protein
MKKVFQTIIFHFTCIVIFTLIYYIFSSHFEKMSNEKKPELIDYFFLGTTIQSGVGYTSLTPITPLAKFIMMIQQFLMLSVNVFLLYIFTL